MAAALQIRPAFKLGDIEIRPSERRVVYGAASETIEPKVMTVLVELAESLGKVVSRDALVDACWGGRIVSEDAIYKALSQVRRLTRRLGEHHFSLETIGKVGYRLRAASIERLDTDGPASETCAPVRREISVCVVPFAAMGADGEQEVVSDCVTEDIITDLGKISALSVTSRHTSFGLKGQAADLKALQRDLGITHVLEGSVREGLGRIRVSVRLIELAQDRIVWAERYDCDSRERLWLQDDISSDVAAALVRTLAL